MGPSTEGQISVVIPAFNAARFLPDALESVLRQTRPALEVIVVDDGSTDATPSVVDGFRGKVVYLRKENGGPSSARNFGTLRARGEWIAYLDADDWCAPERLERQFALAQQTRADFVCSDVAVMNGGSNSLTNAPSWLASINKKAEIESGLVDSVMPDPFRFFMDIGCFALPSTILVRKRCMEEVGFFDEKTDPCEDWDLLLRLAPFCRMAFSAESLVTRRIHGNNISLNDAVVARGAVMFWEKAAQFERISQEPKWRKFAQRRAATYHMQEGVFHAQSNEMSQARAHLLRSLRLGFSTRATVHLILSLLPPSLGNSIRHSVRPLYRSCAGLLNGKMKH